MSLELKLLFVGQPVLDGSARIAHSALQLTCNLSEVLKPIKAEGEPIDYAVIMSDESFDDDPYGDKLTSIAVDKLAGLLRDHEPKLSLWDRSIIPFLRIQPAETRVVLYWV